MTHSRWPLALPLVAAVATVFWLLLREDRASLADPAAGTPVAARTGADGPVGADGAAASTSLPAATRSPFGSTVYLRSGTGARTP
ncbi:MAG: hypothetical protein AB7O97_14205 [Planctomycetota bacterium]